MKTKIQSGRQSNFELMRIVSMFFVVMWHLILHSGLYELPGVIHLVLEFFVLLGVVHINSFVLVTGYFQCEKKFSWRKFWYLFLEVWFYKVLFVIIFYFVGGYEISKLELVKELLPIDMRDYWYVNCYLVLYLLSPWLNKLIMVMEKKEYFRLLVMGFVVFAVIPLVTNQQTVMNDGYTVIHFLYMYLIGGYLKRYPVWESYYFVNWSRKKLQLFFLMISLGCLVINFMSLQFSHCLMGYDNSFIRELGSYLFNNNRLYSNPVVIGQSIGYFLYFAMLKFSNKRVNWVSKVTLDVYLIHENYYMLAFIYPFLRVGEWSLWGSVNVILLVILMTMVIFIFCTICGLVRMKLFGWLEGSLVVKGVKQRVSGYVKDF